MSVNLGIVLGFNPALTGLLPKFEILISKFETNTKIQIQMTKTILTMSELGLRADRLVQPLQWLWFFVFGQHALTLWALNGGGGIGVVCG